VNCSIIATTVKPNIIFNRFSTRYGSNIYLDNNESPPIAVEVAEVMRANILENKSSGNPSRVYWVGLPARQTLENVKMKICHFINTKPDEIIFTIEASNVKIISFKH